MGCGPKWYRRSGSLPAAFSVHAGTSVEPLPLSLMKGFMLCSKVMPSGRTSFRRWRYPLLLCMMRNSSPNLIIVHCSLRKTLSGLHLVGSHMSSPTASSFQRALPNEFGQHWRMLRPMSFLSQTEHVSHFEILRHCSWQETVFLQNFGA